MCVLGRRTRRAIIMWCSISMGECATRLNRWNDNRNLMNNGQRRWADAMLFLLSDTWPNDSSTIHLLTITILSIVVNWKIVIWPRQSVALMSFNLRISHYWSADITPPINVMSFMFLKQKPLNQKHAPNASRYIRGLKGSRYVFVHSMAFNGVIIRSNAPEMLFRYGI